MENKAMMAQLEADKIQNKKEQTTDELVNYMNCWCWTYFSALEFRGISMSTRPVILILILAILFISMY
jgi:hypothetical protein